MTTQKLVTGRGKLEWVTIEGEGKANMSGKMQYVANLVIEADDPIVAKIEKFWADNKPAGFKGPCKSNGVYNHKVDSGKTDEDGDKIYTEDGKVYLSFKTGISYADGKAKVIQIYNAKNNKVRLPEGVSIGNGSIGAISGAMGIYKNEVKGKLLEAGVSLYLDAIQIIKLEEYSADAGFAEDESAGDEGWTGDEGFSGEPTESAAKVRI
jgi:hypothetical protein